MAQTEYAPARKASKSTSPSSLSGVASTLVLSLKQDWKRLFRISCSRSCRNRCRARSATLSGTRRSPAIACSPYLAHPTLVHLTISTDRRSTPHDQISRKRSVVLDRPSALVPMYCPLEEGLPLLTLDVEGQDLLYEYQLVAGCCLRCLPLARQEPYSVY